MIFCIFTYLSDGQTLEMWSFPIQNCSSPGNPPSCLYPCWRPPCVKKMNEQRGNETKTEWSGAARCSDVIGFPGSALRAAASRCAVISRPGRGAAGSRIEPVPEQRRVTSNSIMQRFIWKPQPFINATIDLLLHTNKHLAQGSICMCVCVTW